MAALVRAGITVTSASWEGQPPGPFELSGAFRDFLESLDDE